MPHARRRAHRKQFGHGDRAGDRDAAQVVADQVDDHDVLRDVLDRRPQRRRIRVPRQRALDRARRHRLTAAPQEQLGRQRRHRAPVAGEIGRPRGRGAFHRVDEEVDRRAVEPAGELRAHTCLVDLARGDGLQAVQHAAAVGVAVGVTPGDVAVPRRRRGPQRVGNPLRKRCAGKAFVPPLPVAVLAQHAVRPAAGRLGNPRRPARRRRRRDTTGSRTSRRRPRRRRPRLVARRTPRRGRRRTPPPTGR